MKDHVADITSFWNDTLLSASRDGAVHLIDPESGSVIFRLVEVWGQGKSSIFYD